MRDIVEELKAPNIQIKAISNGSSENENSHMETYGQSMVYTTKRSICRFKKIQETQQLMKKLIKQV